LQRHALQAEQLRAGARAQLEHLVQLAAVERRTSAEPCTSMNLPSPVITRFMSVSALLSST
jgi:hypothetical protein